MDTVEERVTTYVRQAAGALGDDITPDTRLDQLGIDSFGLFEVLLGLEEKFGISIKNEDFSIANFRTVGRMIEFVTAELSGGKAE